jgi:hypothetical protein
MRNPARQRAWQRALAVGVHAAVAAAVLGGLATAAASPAGASSTKAAAAGPDAKSHGFLEAVSCLPSRWCMAVGSNSTSEKAVAWVWNHGSWHQLADPPGGALTGVSCSARTFCIATGFRGSSAAVLWNGTKWQVMIPAPKHVVTAPSCASSDLCAVINGTGFLGSGAIAETWNGQAWKSWKDTSFCVRHPSACGDVDVSCSTATLCVGVGFTTVLGGDALPRAAVWDGKNWHINNPPRIPKRSVTIPHAVSCTGTFCMTVGDAARPEAYVATYDATAGTWKNVSSTARLPWPHATCGGACFLPGTLSCASSTRCMTAGLAGFFAWNGRQFRPSHPVSAGRGSKLSRVSCVKAFCMAVGYRTINGVRAPLSELWNGTTWKILPIT